MGRDPQIRPQLDGVRPPEKRQPDLRPDHDLPAPKPTPLLEAHGPVDPSKLPPVDISDETPAPPPRIKKWLLIAAATAVLAIISVVIVAFAWYQQALTPVSSDTTKHIRVTIDSGMAPSAIANALKNAGVIRSMLAFTLYTKLTHTENSLKAGTYSIQPSLSTQGIVDHLVSGKEDTFDVSFLPGDTLMNNRQKLIGFGYSAAEVDAALAKAYDRPLFATKPAGTDLEGYLFGETIEFDSSAMPEQILGRFFDQYETAITENNLVNGFKKQGLTLYQGITLASIVQREMSSNAKDMPQVARVFLNRLQTGMTLGSDVTYQYAAKKLGVAPDPKLDSPYNTRIHAGLPPGPIATPGLSALRAVANPASNDYLFFLSGDDNVTYFAKTEAQHQQNVVSHCQKKCSIN